MRLLPKRFDLRLSLLFWLLLTVFGAVQTGGFFYITWRCLDEWQQRINWNTASQIARDLRPLLASGEDLVKISKLVSRIEELNPQIGVALVTSEGRIYHISNHFDLIGEEENPELVQAIEEFLSLRKNRRLPLYAPYRPDTLFFNRLLHHRTFSAARVVFRGEPAYLYVALRGGRAIVFLRGLQDVYSYFGIGGFWLLITLAMTLLGAVLFYAATARFRSIAGAVHKITKGDYHERVVCKGNDEVAELSADINVMADSIEQSIEKLKDTDRLRRELVANISHDLKTPIASMLVYLESVMEKEQVRSDPELRKQLDVAVNNASQLSSLVKDLFELSRLEAKDTEPRREPFLILEVVTEDVLPRLKPFAAEEGISLRVDAPDWLPLVLADQSMITRVLVNLIENAIRYSGKGSLVAVELEQTNGKIQVCVKDNGRGIPAAELPVIFDRFYRADHSREKEGRGLGLAIVKQIIEAHNESIRVESTEGKGTVFSFSLPIALRTVQ